MTDKEKIRAEIERLKYQSAIDSDRQAERGLQSASMASFGKEKACKELLSFIDSMQEEPVSEDLEEVIRKYEQRLEKENPATEAYDFASAIRFGAQWQKERMMEDSVLCGVDGWFINNKRNCRKNGRFYKYYVSTITHDKPLPMENGRDYRIITIKED